MLPVPTTQAIALNYVKTTRAPRPSKAGSNAKPRIATKRRLLWRVLEALAEARMRKAEIEIEHHRQFYRGHTK